jgi:hypothetical protein
MIETIQCYAVNRSISSRARGYVLLESRSDERKRHCFLLCLSDTAWDQATQFAQDEGVSVNQFVRVALHERITKIEQHRAFVALSRKESN